MTIQIDLTVDERLFLIGLLTSRIDEAKQHLDKLGAEETILTSTKIREKLINYKQLWINE